MQNLVRSLDFGQYMTRVMNNISVCTVECIFANLIVLVMCHSLGGTRWKVAKGGLA